MIRAGACYISVTTNVFLLQICQHHSTEVCMRPDVFKVIRTGIAWTG